MSTREFRELSELGEFSELGELSELGEFRDPRFRLTALGRRDKVLKIYLVLMGLECCFIPDFFS